MVSDDVAIATGQTAVFVDGDFIRVTANSVQDSRTSMFEVFLIGGVPLNEPVVQYGPFVMNSMDEIQQAFEDFQAGRLGRVPVDAVQPHRP
jgi:redox-sensitive bicupin YhaK (pirin superfamily)